MIHNADLPKSKHFRLEQLAEGVYAAIAKEGGLAGANAGIIALGDCTLIFDTFMAPQAARDLVTAAEALTNHSVTCAVNSHYHWDHILGNQALPPQADLYATTETRELMMAHIPSLIKEQRETAPQTLQMLKTQLQTEADEAKRQEITEYIAFWQMALEDLPTLALRLPNRTFAQKLTFYGVERTVELLTFGGGHTASDALLYLPAERIVFTADLLVNGYHPWLGDGNPTEWLSILDQIEELKPAMLVPGHGSVGTIAHLEAIRQYILALQNLAERAVERGESKDYMVDLAVPAPFGDWIGEPTFGQNMRFLHQALSEKSQ